MADELYGTPGTEAAQGYTPLPDDHEQAPEKTYSSDSDGVREAAKDRASSLREEREAGHTDQEPIVRAYARKSGDGNLEGVEPNATIKQARAARDLADVRKFETGVSLIEDARNFVNEVDQLRGEVAPQPDFAPQPDAQPAEPVPPGIDPELHKALQNPQVRAALQQEMVQVETAKQRYAGAVTHAGQIAVATLFSHFPELQNITVDQFPVAMQLMQAQNPARHAEVGKYLNQVQVLYSEGQRLKAQANETHAREVEFYAKQEGDKFDDSIKNEPPELVKAVKEAVWSVAKQVYGLDREALVEGIRQNPILRSATFQRMMFDATRFHLAQRSAQAQPVRAVPQVQRPGTLNGGPRPTADNSAHEKFIKSPTAKTAAAFLSARRSAKS